MDEKLVRIFNALTVDDAQRLADILEKRGIESYVENTESPLYGMTQGPASHVLYVDWHVAAEAREVVRQFEADWHPGVPRDEQMREQTGLELPDDPKPSQDSPNEELDMGVERLNANRPGPEAPEIEDLVAEDENASDDRRQEIDWSEHHPVGFGPDRPMTEDAEVESEEFTDSLDEPEAEDEREGS